MSRAHKGVVHYTNGVKVISIHPGEQVPLGFVKGSHPCSEQRKQKLKEKLKGRTSPMKGRTQQTAARQRISQSVRGRKHFTNGKLNIFVLPENVPEGFYPGITINRKKSS